jgi:hypothetical protein
MMVTTTLWVGFLLWIYFDPPGHASWYQLPATAAMIVAGRPQLQVSKIAKALAVSLPFGLGVYVLIMPQLSGFSELAPMIFIYFFIVNYFFSGLAALAGNLAFLIMVKIQNEQTYNVAAALNSYLFVVGAFFLAYAVSHLTWSPRPEKAFLHLLRRFFRSSGFLISRSVFEPGRSATALERWRAAYHRQELATLPGKLEAWSGFIDPEKFPGNTPEQVQALLTGLQALAYRIQALLETREAPQRESLVRELHDEVRTWRLEIERVFRSWSEDPGAERADALGARLAERLARLETRISEGLTRVTEGELGTEDYQNAYRLLGSYRGVSEAAVSYAGLAGELEWARLREERF